MRRICGRRTVFVVAHRLSRCAAPTASYTIERGRYRRHVSHARPIRSTGGMQTSICCRRGNNDGCRKIIKLPNTVRSSGGATKPAFLPAALEVVETPPSPLGRAVGVTIILLWLMLWPWRWRRWARSMSSRPQRERSS